MAADPWRMPPTLAGRHVTLLPLRTDHARALAQAAADGELWRLAYTGVPDADGAEAYVARALQMQAAGEALPFAVVDRGGSVVGSTRYYQLDSAVPRLSIGYTWYAARAQRTALNTEAKRLLLGQAFDVMQCEAVAFETSHRNLRSQAAIERLGARRDGVLRAHMRHRDGSLRDTVAYSILRSEWPSVRDGLDARLEAA
ncbi:GNAT family N-acetyltransferase [Lysobacter sp. N42]|uniref:GNAT family N-acetyltransferase n=1 Tax=Lysobacter sp. N42 TaxID=2545719 RepID=UPI001050D776|nr:GNAT family N-acetyltransferase [Lysobacter sp. N42]TCZ88117.1 N-acetyltransferase [Lysobacter sp. N42]